MAHAHDPRRLIFTCIKEARPALRPGLRRSYHLKPRCFASQHYNGFPKLGIQPHQNRSLSLGRYPTARTQSLRAISDVSASHVTPLAEELSTISSPSPTERPVRKSKITNDFDQAWWELNYGLGPKDAPPVRRSQQIKYNPTHTSVSRHLPSTTAVQGGERRGSFQREKAPSLKIRGRKTEVASMNKQAERPRKDWQIQKEALRAKFPTGWQPRKRLSPDALDGIRSLHMHDPQKYTTPILAQQFAVPAEAVRRILKSSWKPSEDEQEARRARWERRGIRKWTEMSKKGYEAPQRWKAALRGEALPSIDDRETAAAWSLLHSPNGDSEGEKTMSLADRFM